MHQDTNVRNLHRNSILCEECCIKRAKKKRKKSRKHSSSRRCSACGARIELAELDNPCLHADFLCFHHRPCCQCDKRSEKRRRDTSTSSSSDSFLEDARSVLKRLLSVPTDTTIQNLVVEPRTSAFAMPAEDQCPPCSDPSSPEARSPSIGAPSSAPERHNMPIRELRIPQLQSDRVRLQNTYAPYGNNDFCAGGMHEVFPPQPPQFSQFPSSGDLSLTSYMKLPEPQRPQHHFGRIPPDRVRLHNTYPPYGNFYERPENTWHGIPQGHNDFCAGSMHGVSPPQPPQFSQYPSPGDLSLTSFMTLAAP